VSHSRSELNIPNIHSILVIVIFHYCVVILLLLALLFLSSSPSSLSQNLSSLVHKFDIAFTPDCCSRPCENIELRQIAIDPSKESGSLKSPIFVREEAASIVVLLKEEEEEDSRNGVFVSSL
jgi:hypothetical protein